MSFKALVGKGAVSAGLLLLCQGVVASTTVYKTTDDDGGVVYTDRPSLHGEAETVEGLATESTDFGSLDAAEQQAAVDQAAEDVLEQQEDAVAASEQEHQTAVAAQRDNNCKAAKERLTRYSNAGRLYRTDDNGEREYLTNEELDEQRQSAASSVDEWCS